MFRTGNNFASDVTNESDPYFEVMVWAALSLYPEIAYLMWKGTQEPIRAALFVVMLLKRLRKAKKVIINANDKNIIDTMLDDFEVRAIAILDTLHETDSTVCERALNSVWERLGNKTYIDMAHKCRAREFIAHPACQEICEYRWKRGLNTEVSNYWGSGGLIQRLETIGGLLQMLVTIGSLGGGGLIQMLVTIGGLGGGLNTKG